MNRKRVEPVFLTLLCTVLILGIGYVGIVKGGRLLLGNEQKPEKTEFEDTGSKVFYGKIEEDIQLFPWNYYGQNEIQGTMESVIGDYQDAEALEEVVQYMEAYCCGVEKEVIEAVYQQKQSSIVNSMKICETESGYFFFYQDILEVEGIQYQVKLALGEQCILSFSCTEYQKEDIRTIQQWEEGEKMLADMLERYQWQIGDRMYNIQYPYGEYLYKNNGARKEMANVYVNSYIENMTIVNNMLTGKYEEIEENESVDGAAGSVIQDADWLEMQKIDIAEEGYSYQVIELNDMILLLLQGEYNMGLFFDPVRQEFCGFNYFM